MISRYTRFDECRVFEAAGSDFLSKDIEVSSIFVVVDAKC